MKIKMWKKYIVTGMIMVCLVATLTACAAKDDGNKVDKNPVTSEVVEQTEVEETEESNKPEETTEVVEESTEEVAASTEVVEETEDLTANLSNEEWVDYLNIQTPTYIIFNEINGNRKVLENEEKYTLQEGDILAIRTPPQTYRGGMQSNTSLYITTDIRYNCKIYELNLDSITVDTEFSIGYTHAETGEEVNITVYLSK